MCILFCRVTPKSFWRSTKQKKISLFSNTFFNEQRTSDFAVKSWGLYSYCWDDIPRRCGYLDLYAFGSMLLLTSCFFFHYCVSSSVCVVRRVWSLVKMALKSNSGSVQPQQQLCTIIESCSTASNIYNLMIHKNNINILIKIHQYPRELVRWTFHWHNVIK